MMTAEGLPGQMRSAALALLAALDDQQRKLAALPFADDAARRWLEYRPRHRPGACLAQLSVTARKAAHRLLATGLREHAYAHAMAIVALEEVLAAHYREAHTPGQEVPRPGQEVPRPGQEVPRPGPAAPGAGQGTHRPGRAGQ